MLQSLATALMAIALTACSGYQLSGSKPAVLSAVNKIHVPLANNDTQIPRAAAMVTNQVVDAIVQDGIYQISTADKADAVLHLTFHTVNYSAIRTARANRLRPEELAMTVSLKWKITPSDNPLQVLDSGESIGRTNLFVAPNLQMARQSALSDALQRAATSLVSRISNGF